MVDKKPQNNRSIEEKKRPILEELAKWMHNEYEKASKKVKWDTQKSCKVKFKDLPENNQKVMIIMAEKVQKKLEEFNEDGLRGCKCERVYLDEGF